MVVPHSELNLDENECTTGRTLAGRDEGIAFSKTFLESQLPGDPQSSGKEPGVHRAGVEIEPL
jgi:hypothetical protein